MTISDESRCLQPIKSATSWLVNNHIIINLLHSNIPFIRMSIFIVIIGTISRMASTVMISPTVTEAVSLYLRTI